ncbi:MAG: Hsp20/alpha crystallin family protein [Desulfobacterales bacterium]
MLYRSMWGFPGLRRGPFEELDRIRREMDRLVNEFVDPTRVRGVSGVFPPVNLTEDRNHYYVRAEMPGVSSENLDVQATGRNLSISGERKIPEAGEGVRYHRREREGGTFSRAISLPGEIDADRIEASLVNGILTVTIPKSEASKPRQISIR